MNVREVLVVLVRKKGWAADWRTGQVILWNSKRKTSLCYTVYGLCLFRFHATTTSTSTLSNTSHVSHNIHFHNMCSSSTRIHRRRRRKEWVIVRSISIIWTSSDQSNRLITNDAVVDVDDILSLVLQKALWSIIILSYCHIRMKYDSESRRRIQKTPMDKKCNIRKTVNWWSKDDMYASENQQQQRKTKDLSSL